GLDEGSAPEPAGRPADQRMNIRTALVFLMLVASTVHAEWGFEAETGIVYDSNLSNSDRSADVRDDWAWRSDVSVNNGLQLMRDLRLNLGADVRGDAWDRYDAFNTVGVGASAGLRYRFGLGRQAPWVLLEDRFGYDRFHDTPQSGNDNAVNLRGGVALTERIALEGGYAFESFVAPNEFYDRQFHRADARMVFDVTSSCQLALGYSYQARVVLSESILPRPDIALIDIEREDEDEFGQPLRTAYKLLGRIHALSF